DGSVTNGKLAAGSVGTEQLISGSITADKLAPGLLTDYSIGSAAIQAEHIADSSITAHHIRQRSIELSALRFSPVITSLNESTVKQQFGLAPYSFTSQAEQLELDLSFHEPYADSNYVLTVTTDNPACYAVVHSKSADKAVIVIIRTRITLEPSGNLNWIAIGRA
ncbi:WIAG-tail domain, partial [Paenibacillus harenae]|uniref:WIAG-tail domain n=1 Tax=Paenibacillus harenae TaxID=306543 RepID=UPI0005617A75